jgi:helix-turn-helix protein
MKVNSMERGIMTFKETVSAGIGHNGGPPLEPINPSDSADEQEAAVELGVTSGTLATWRSQGRGPIYFKAGRRVRYPRAALRNFLASKLTVPQPARVRRLARAHAAVSSEPS